MARTYRRHNVVKIVTLIEPAYDDEGYAHGGHTEYIVKHDVPKSTRDHTDPTSKHKAVIKDWANSKRRMESKALVLKALTPLS